MKAVIQRVTEASVTVDGVPTGTCGAGLMILLGVAGDDTEDDALLLADKIVKLRIFSDEADKMNLSLLDVGGGALIVPNFTLNANYAKGNRPDYFAGAAPAVANALYLHFVDLMRARLTEVGTGVFGADMKISMICDGPITICMNSEKLRKGKRK